MRGCCGPRGTARGGPHDCSGTIQLPSGTPGNRLPRFLRHGAFAGLFGAALLAAYFLYVDVLRGKPLFTPTLLASALLGRDTPQTLQASLWLASLYTVFHGLVFVGIGVGAAYLLHHFEVVRHRGLIIVLLFTVLCLGFFALAANVRPSARRRSRSAMRSWATRSPPSRSESTSPATGRGRMSRRSAPGPRAPRTPRPRRRAARGRRRGARWASASHRDLRPPAGRRGRRCPGPFRLLASGIGCSSRRVMPHGQVPSGCG